MTRATLLLSLLALTACAEIPLVFGPLTLVEPAAPKALAQPRLTSRARDEPVLVTPVWRKTRAEVEANCGDKVACVHRWRQDGAWHCEIVAIEPRDFNDFERLETLGHEAWHCLGASHD